MQWTSFHLDDLGEEQRASSEPWLEFLRVPALRAGLYVLAPGAWDHQSPHEEDEIYCVVAGRATFEAGVDRQDVRSGSIIYVAARQPHRFTNITEELRVLVFFSAPLPRGERT
jgi:mannose-6-phosphate isomerase-like protein (cupin superfamily)